MDGPPTRTSRTDRRILSQMHSDSVISDIISGCRSRYLVHRARPRGDQRCCTTSRLGLRCCCYPTASNTKPPHADPCGIGHLQSSPSGSLGECPNSGVIDLADTPSSVEEGLFDHRRGAVAGAVDLLRIDDEFRGLLKSDDVDRHAAVPRIPKLLLGLRGVTQSDD